MSFFFLVEDVKNRRRRVEWYLSVFELGLFTIIMFVGNLLSCGHSPSSLFIDGDPMAVEMRYMFFINL